MVFNWNAAARTERHIKNRYKKGYVEARRYTRANADAPIKAAHYSLDYDHFDKGWDDGTSAELKRLGKSDDN